jgi:hypothetical protein
MPARQIEIPQRFFSWVFGAFYVNNLSTPSMDYFGKDLFQNILLGRFLLKLS